MWFRKNKVHICTNEQHIIDTVWVKTIPRKGEIIWYRDKDISYKVDFVLHDVHKNEVWVMVT